MARIRKQAKTVPRIKREQIYNGEMECPLCHKPVSPFRVQVFLEQSQSFNDFLGKCPICRY